MDQDIKDKLALLMGQFSFYSAIAAPLLPPNALKVLGIAQTALLALQNASNIGDDVTDEQLAAMFDAYEQGKVADQLVQAAASRPADNG